MSQDRLVELVILATEDRADDAELAELESLMRADPTVALLLRRHLAIDDILSQQLAAERGAEPFLAGFHERVRIEADGDAFHARVMAAVDRERPWSARAGDWGLRVGGFAAAAMLAIGLLSALLAGVQAPAARPAHRVDGITALRTTANPGIDRLYVEALGRAQ